MEIDAGELNSQEMSCCPWLSPPSEPPHIGKWFSSYKYESPEVNFDEAVENVISGDVDASKLRTFYDERHEKRGEDSVELKPFRKRKTVQACEKNSSSEPDDDIDIQHNNDMNQMNEDSLSLPTEPPDIRNWFSSYVYQSPEVDSQLNMSVFRKIQIDQQDISNKQKILKSENDGNYKKKCVSQFDVNKSDDLRDLAECRSPLESDDTNVIRFSDSASLASEPPDIRNWFSSYVHESPAVFMDGELGVPSIKAIQSGDCDEGTVNSNGRNMSFDISNSWNKTSMHDKDVLPDLTPSHRHNNSNSFQGNCKLDEDGMNKEYFPTLSDQIVEETQTQHAIDSPLLRNKTTSDLNESRSPRRLLRRKRSKGKHSIIKSCSKEVSLANTVALATEVSPTNELEKKSNSLQRTIILEQDEYFAEVADKENGQPNAEENGFVSTKKRRKIPNRDSPNFLQKQERVATFRTTQTGSSKRVGMSDVTNTQHSIEQEISGKWKCPQRSKSNVQPPMKQLRLEQWITRA